ncbi:family 78 glycoside hydrolase catalytic domain [Mucilaginibacter sp. CSA2-8R]|uniref:alpha-L-rhamnosidase n=1 Tax=Mucilaginibacter sp. CSA2-8R TaxID=3141542 RepID=UPI00315DC2D4
MHASKKINRLSFLLSFVIALVIPAIVKAENAAVVNLQCEHLYNPIGLDNPNVRLSWVLQDVRSGARQEAYQLAVGTDEKQVSAGRGNVWQTSKITSDANLVTYAGKPLQPFTRYYWTVTLWDKNGKPVKAAANSFEMGMMGQSHWRGSWISDEHGVDEKAAPYLRKAFNVQKQITSARAYIAAAGLYELYINGLQVGDHRLDPMYTRFDRRNLYVTYDVTRYLQKGENAVGILLGNGWYNFQSRAVWDFERAPWRNRPAVCMDIHITYSDGTTDMISTDKTWKTMLSPLVFNSIYTGEQYDARREVLNWNKPDFNDNKWNSVINRQAPSAHITAQAMVPVRNVEKIVPVSFKKINDTAYLYNLGRNIAGVSQITLTADSNTRIKLVHAERLNAQGLPDQSNVDYFLTESTKSTDPFATDVYYLKGKGTETFAPRFNYKGFQYVEVTSNKPIQLKQESLVGWFMHSDVAQVGHINTSNPLLNKLYAATNASYLSNLFGYPTDCPQREKNGWTGDAHIASDVGLYNFDVITVYEKWMADHRDEQQPNGVLPSIIPTDGWGYEWGNGPDWTSTVAIIPWNVYLFYGDQKILKDSYDAIKRYVNYIDEKYPSGLTTWGLGDWAPVKSKTPVELTSSVYYFVDVDILAKAAQILGKQSDFKIYTGLAAKIKQAINAKYLNSQTGQYADGYQTEQAVPLYWGIVPNQLKPKAAAILARSVVANNYHLDVGILGAKAILGALSDNGQAETAYKLATQDTFPSWGWWMANGATTLYENWDLTLKRDLSLNHIMFGEIGAWMFKTLAGIKPNESRPGFKHFFVQPAFVQGLDNFEAQHTGPLGNVISSWRRTGQRIAYHIEVPANTTATIIFPADKAIYNGKKKVPAVSPINVNAGVHDYIIEKPLYP